MSKKKYGFTIKKYEKWLKEGRGQGIGKNYKPWLTIQDVPSLGRSTRLHGIKTDRQHEFLSDLERNYYYILEFSEAVIDIREQYPLLPIEQTIAIAEELGIKHLTDPNTGENTVLTTDFLITVSGNSNCELLARTIKTTEHLDSLRQLEKFEIERRYWKMKGIEWGIVTDKEIDNVIAQNIAIVHPFYSLENLVGFEDMNKSQIDNLIEEFRKEIVGENSNVRHAADLFDERMMLTSGTSIMLFKHLVINKRINIDIYHPLDIDKPMNIYDTKSKIDLGAEVI